MAVTRTFPTGDSLSITDTRRVLGGLLTKNADGNPRAGVFPAHTNPLVTGLSSMSYSVGVFAAATVRVAGGCELVANNAAVTVATTAAPAANRRIDVIWVRSRFTQHSDASNLAEIGVTQGAAAAIPVKPSIPAGALELATAEILSTTTQTATAVITQTAPFTAAAGGVVPVRSAVDLNAFAAAEGVIAQDITTGALYRRSGGGWGPLSPRIGMRRSTQVGTVSASVYTDLSASSFWVEEFRGGFSAYSDGIAIPEPGVYEVSYTISAQQNLLVGVTINKATAVTIGDLVAAATSSTVQGIATATASRKLQLNAGDVLRIFGIASASGGVWRTEPGLSSFQVEHC